MHQQVYNQIVVYSREENKNSALRTISERILNQRESERKRFPQAPLPPEPFDSTAHPEPFDSIRPELKSKDELRSGQAWSGRGAALGRAAGLFSAAWPAHRLRRKLYPALLSSQNLQNCFLGSLYSICLLVFKLIPNSGLFFLDLHSPDRLCNKSRSGPQNLLWHEKRK